MTVQGGGRGDGGGFAPALAAVVIWGLVPVGTRFFVTTTDPLAFNVIRFGASALAALPLAIRAKPWLWRPLDILRLVAGSVLAIPAYNIPVAIAARTVPAGTMGLLIATEPIFILLFSLLLSRAAVRPTAIIGAALAFGGVALTTWSGWAGVGAGDPAGVGLVLLGCACWGLYSVLTAPLVVRYGAAGVASSILVVGGFLLMVGSLRYMGPGAWPGPVVWLELVAMGLMSALLAFLLWNKAAEAMPMSRLGLFLYLIPVVSLIGGEGLLGEQPTFADVCGGVLILVVVAIGEGRLGELAMRGLEQAGRLSERLGRASARAPRRVPE
jgi:drug/metabolite transporter (DMT)-like permease